MISEWFTAREIAQMNLVGLPSTESPTIRRAKRENWKSRPRAASGAGVEYHISALPKAAQIALVERQIGKNTIDTLSKDSSHYLQTNEEKSTTFSADERRVAKITIVKLFEQFRNTTCLSVMDAERPFIKLYEQDKQGDGRVFPRWLYDAYPSFSITSLRRWRKLRQEKDAFDALAGRYGNRKGSGLIERAEEGALKTHIIALILKQPHLNGGHVRDLCRAKFGKTVFVKDARGNREEKALPNVRTFERFIFDWKKNNAEMHLRLTNPDSHKNKYQLALGKADAGIDRLNQLWEIDASPADVLCTDGRYAIYGIIDVYSRRVIYMVTKTPRTEAALLLIRRGIMEWGVPEMIRTDNGADFTSKRFVSALINLGIEQDICPPYSGDKKPFIERSFGTLQRDLMPFLPGFIGHNVADRKAIESRKSFAKRLGEDDAKAFAIELSHPLLQEAIDKWVSNRYSHTEHGGLNNISPFQRAASWKAPIKRIDNLRALDLLLSPIAGSGGFRIIGKKGIRLDGGSFWSSGLFPYMGQRVFVRCNPEDMGMIYCFTEDGEFIAEAKCIEREGVSIVAATAKAKAEQKTFERERIDPLRKEMKKITPAKMAEDILNLAHSDHGHLTAFPKQSESYSTPELAEAARAVAVPMGTQASEKEKADLAQFERDFYEQKTPIVHTQATDEDRWWVKARALHANRNAGEELSPTDSQWLKWAETTHWFKARRDFELMCETTG
jgi:putative transposase